MRNNVAIGDQSKLFVKRNSILLAADHNHDISQTGSHEIINMVFQIGNFVFFKKFSKTVFVVLVGLIVFEMNAKTERQRRILALRSSLISRWWT